MHTRPLIPRMLRRVSGLEIFKMDEWMSDNRDEWISDNRDEWISDNRDEWMSTGRGQKLLS